MYILKSIFNQQIIINIDDDDNKIEREYKFDIKDKYFEQFNDDINKNGISDVIQNTINNISQELQVNILNNI